MKPFEEFARSWAGFSWALPVYGFSQAGKLARELATGNPRRATASFQATTAAMRDQFDELDNSVYEAGEQLQNSLIDLAYRAVPLRPIDDAPPRGDAGKDGYAPAAPAPSTPAGRASQRHHDAPPPCGTYFPHSARSVGAEEVFSVYNIGKGTFDKTTQYINLQVQMYDYSSRWVGVQTGVHVNTTPLDPPDLLPKQLFSVPSPPAGSIQQLPVPREHRTEWTKGLFTFADGSSIAAEGPAWTHLVPIKDGSFIFMVTTSHVITKGTGRFEGARGIKQGTGSTYVAPGLFPTRFPSPGFQFEAKVIDTFRVIRQGFQK